MARASWILLRISIFCITCAAFAQNQDFSGEWRLDSSRSEVRGLPAPPDAVLRVQVRSKTLAVSGDNGAYTYPLDGSEAKTRAGASSMRTVAKWEGAALLVNTIVNGPQSYTVMERWQRSRDGSRLTITRTVVRLGRETESVLVYENASVAAVAKPADRPAAEDDAPALAARKAPVEPQPEQYKIDAGTKILLALVSSVNTKAAASGDRVYLETRYPVLSKGRVIIPRGSQVLATVTDSHRAGRVKGKAELYLRFDMLVLPNGVTRDFRSRPATVDEADIDRKEGKIIGPGGKGKDAGTVATTTGAGTSIGTIAGGAAGHYGMGAAIGAAAGAAAGLAGVLGSRGQDLVLPRGTTMEMVLDRDLLFNEKEL